MQGFRDVLKLIGAFIAATVVGFLLLVYGPNTVIRGLGWGIAVIGVLGGLVTLGAFVVVGGWTAIADLFSGHRPGRALIMLATAAVAVVIIVALTASP